jgi:hypothetical protein
VREARIELGVVSSHLTQVIAGFALLRAGGELRVHVRRAPLGAIRRDDGVLRVEGDGGQRLVFELRDGTDVDPVSLDWSTTYLKRGYRTEVHGADARIVPLGLNYVVSAAHDWRIRRLAWGMLAGRPSTVRSTAARVWSATYRPPDVAAFEAPVPSSARPTALLMTRVWDPRRVDEEKAAEWEAMNELRTGCIRALAAELGDRFTGGLTDTPWARERYPDLVLGDEVTERRRYLARMQATDVCVATGGLRRSNGWRLAEYLAASRAVVTEPLFHEVPGDLADGHGLVEASTVDGCVSAVVDLLADADRRRTLGETGRAYYDRHVRPDALVRTALEAAR